MNYIHYGNYINYIMIIISTSDMVFTISIMGFKCAFCGGEFGSRAGMDCHRRHNSSVGTPCADPMNSKSISFTGRADQSGGIPRQHDTLGATHIRAFFF